MCDFKLLTTRLRGIHWYFNVLTVQFCLLLCMKLLREDCWVMCRADYWNRVGNTEHFVTLKQTTQRTFTDMWFYAWLSLLQGTTFGYSFMLGGIVLMFLSSLCSVLLLFCFFFYFSLGGNRQHFRLKDPGNVGMWCSCLAIKLCGNRPRKCGLCPPQEQKLWLRDSSWLHQDLSLYIFINVARSSSN